MKRLLLASLLCLAGCQTSKTPPGATATSPAPSGWQAVSFDGASAGFPGDWKASELKVLEDQTPDMSGDPAKALPGMCRSALSMFVESGERGVFATPADGVAVVSLSTHERRDAVVAADPARELAQAIDRSPLHTGGGTTQEPTTLGGKPAVKVTGHLSGSSTGDGSMDLVVAAIIGSSDKMEWRIISVSPAKDPVSLDEIAATWTGK